MRRPPPPHAHIHLPPTRRILRPDPRRCVRAGHRRHLACTRRCHGRPQAARGIGTPRSPDAVWESVPDGPHDDCF